MKKIIQGFALPAVIAAAVVFIFAGCAELFHGEPSIYTVIFFNNGSFVDSREVEAGLELGSLPRDPVRSGYTFAGWYSGDTKYTASTVIKESVELDARWVGGSGNQDRAPSTPTGVTATALSSSSIQVSWSQVSGATGYNIYRSDSLSETSTPVRASPSTPYTDAGLTPNTTYYYRVSAYNSNGESAQSIYDSATTQSGGPEPGSSSDTAIVLSSNGSSETEGTLSPDSPQIWYTFSIPNNNVTYWLLGRDIYNSGTYAYTTYTSDVVFEIYDAGLNMVKSIDAGSGGYYFSPEGIKDSEYIEETNAAGKWYVKVVPREENTFNYGTYTIYFYYH